VEPLKFKTVREAYDHIYKEEKGIYVRQGLDKDKASRLANIKAVENAWFLYNVLRETWKVKKKSIINKQQGEII